MSFRTTRSNCHKMNSTVTLVSILHQNMSPIDSNKTDKLIDQRVFLMKFYARTGKCFAGDPIYQRAPKEDKHGGAYYLTP